MNCPSTFGLLRMTLDIVIASILLLVACVLAGVVHDFTGANQLWLYAVLLAIGTLPFLLYARYRGVAEFDRWDFLAYSIVPVIVALVLSWTSQPILIIAAAVASTSFAAGLRRLFPLSNRAAI